MEGLYDKLLEDCIETMNTVQKEQAELAKRLLIGLEASLFKKEDHINKKENLDDIDIEAEAIKWIKNIILPALKEESHNRPANKNVSILIVSYHGQVYISDMYNFGINRMIQEGVYIGKYINVVFEKVFSILKDLQSKGNTIVGTDGIYRDTWKFTCPI